jgi:two-component system OmpR family response regulator
MAKPKHIVVADDEEGVRFILAEILSEAGYRVSTAGNGEALRKIVAGSDRVDLVVLDAVMPGERSRTLAAHLRDLRIFVVAISGHPVVMKLALDRDLQLLEKPFRAIALEAAIEEALVSGKYGQRGASPARSRRLYLDDDRRIVRFDASRRDRSATKQY